MRDFLQLSHFVASKLTFSYEFSYEPLNLLPQNRCFVRGFHQLSSHLTKCHACHKICTLSPRSPAIRKKHATRHVSSAAPATQNDDGHVQSAARTRKTATHLAKTSQKYRACHTKRLSTRYKTRLNVTKCHACHAKRSNATFETSKNDPFCKTYHRHSHIAITRTVANGCGRLRTVRQRRANTPSTPRPPRVNREPLLRIREKGRSGQTRLNQTRTLGTQPFDTTPAM